MSSELKKRLVTTLALLFATHVLGYFPIPLINFDSLLRLMNQPDFSLMTAMDVGTIGALGINPYVIASLFVVFIFYFRKLRNNERKLCPECTDKNNDRFTCDEHSCVELIEGWATALTTTTRLEAELHKCRLESGGLSALVHSNTIEPIYGTLGLFEINPVTPFFVYRELGGGSIRVMVPMHDWTNAQESLQSY
ncbi:MAG: hypothetical protein ACE1ZS_07000 [Candidatus Poribacteria bacterium]